MEFITLPSAHRRGPLTAKPEIIVSLDKTEAFARLLQNALCLFALCLLFRTESQIRYESSQQDTLVVKVATAIMIGSLHRIICRHLHIGRRALLKRVSS